MRKWILERMGIHLVFPRRLLQLATDFQLLLPTWSRMIDCTKSNHKVVTPAWAWKISSLQKINGTRRRFVHFVRSGYHQRNPDLRLIIHYLHYIASFVCVSESFTQDLSLKKQALVLSPNFDRSIHRCCLGLDLRSRLARPHSFFFFNFFFYHLPGLSMWSFMTWAEFSDLTHHDLHSGGWSGLTMHWLESVSTCFLR